MILFEVSLEICSLFGKGHNLKYFRVFILSTKNHQTVKLGLELHGGQRCYVLCCPVLCLGSPSKVSHRPLKVPFAK